MFTPLLFIGTCIDLNVLPDYRILARDVLDRQGTVSSSGSISLFQQAMRKDRDMIIQSHRS
ncbi:hypothetical protein Mapa_001926 [Marchantia paleacea]|nr:hypothetical protein Mapa_001926 [Marchantia paleacea]